MKKTILATAALASLAACATKPENIQAQYISDMKYTEYTCRDIAYEMARTEEALTVASGQQNKARRNDTLGVVFVGLPVSSISGGNVKDEIGRLKGEVKAMEQASMKKGCRDLVGEKR